jgi:hypothetical protein
MKIVKAEINLISEQKQPIMILLFYPIKAYLKLRKICCYFLKFILFCPNITVINLMLNISIY